MPSPYKGLQSLGKIGRIFVPDSFLKREQKKLEDQRREQRRIVRREHAVPFGRTTQDRPKRKNPKVTNKRRRKIAHESRKRNRGT